MAKTKVLITVKTYPNLSSKYDELVCTAGFTEEGKWIRIYPVPFRKLPYAVQYKKYDWLEMDLERNKSDFRLESFKPVNIDNPGKITGHIEPKGNWEERKKFALKRVYDDMSELIKEAKNKKICTSLATFKPTKILNFTYKKESSEWSKEKLLRGQQMNLFESAGGKIEVLRKLPYKFIFSFEDKNSKQSNMMIEDWETGALYWNMLKKYGDEKQACESVKEKYFNDFAKTKELYFFLGTTKLNHFVGRNPFIIIGTFHPKKETQTALEF